LLAFFAAFAASFAARFASFAFALSSAWRFVIFERSALHDASIGEPTDAPQPRTPPEQVTDGRRSSKARAGS
jgi:hypothetical protein